MVETIDANLMKDDFTNCSLQNLEKMKNNDGWPRQSSCILESIASHTMKFGKNMGNR